MKPSPSVIAAATLLSSVHAQKNDWTKPCFNGVCIYDNPKDTRGSNASVSGFMKIWGSPSAITDVTPAAGWFILDCDPQKMEQDIRLVCKSNNLDEAGCSHLFQDIPPTGKVVRLPENCGKMPFARVARSWIPDDQSVPPSVSAKLVRRDGQAAQVHALAIDTNFAAVDPTTSGPVNIQVVGSNIPGKEGRAKPTSGLVARAFVDDAFAQFSKTDQSDMNKLPPIVIQKQVSLFKDSATCPSKGLSPGFSVGVDTNVDYQGRAQVAIGVATSGTMVPPNLVDLALYANIDADLNGSFNLKARGSRGVDTGSKTLIEQKFPGLEFPGILTVGPTIKLTGNAKASLGTDVDMNVNIAYSVKNAEMFWPKSQLKPSAQAAPDNSLFTLSVNPSVNGKASGRVEAHLIPSVNFGLTALGGAATSTVFINLDKSAVVDMNVQRSAPATTPAVPGKGGKKPVPATTKSQINGCANVRGQLNIDASTNAAFFNIYSATTKQSLFTKSFDLVKKCTSTAGKRSLPRGVIYEQLERKELEQLEQEGRELERSMSQRRAAASCPAALPTLTLLFKEPIRGSKLQ